MYVSPDLRLGSTTLWNTSCRIWICARTTLCTGSSWMIRVGCSTVHSESTSVGPVLPGWTPLCRDLYLSQLIYVHEEALRRVKANEVSPLTQLLTRFISYNILTLFSKLQAFIVKQRYRKWNTTSWKCLKDKQDERNWEPNTPTYKNAAQLGAVKLAMEKRISAARFDSEVITRCGLVSLLETCILFNLTTKKKVMNILSVVKYGQVHWRLRWWNPTFINPSHKLETGSPQWMLATYDSAELQMN